MLKLNGKIGIILKPYLNPTSYSFSNKVSIDKMDQFPVEDYEIGERLDRFLKKSPIGWISAQKYLREKKVIVTNINNSKIINDPRHRLAKGDVLLLAPDISSKYSKEKVHISNITYQQAKKSLDTMILFDNQNITVLNKQPGYTVQGGDNQRLNLFTLMAARYKKQFVHITHRLDKSTSGIVLFAKNRESAQLIQKAMENRNFIEKYYIALCQGPQIQTSGYIRCNIQWAHGKAKLCSETKQESKDCVTLYTTLLKEKLKQTDKINASNRHLLGLKLLTGRKHQLRCHLAKYIDNPILNDSKYGGRLLQKKQNTPQQKDDEQSIFLHAAGMRISDSQILQKVFKQQNVNKSSDLGAIMMIGQAIDIMASPPSYWNQYLNGEKIQSLVQEIMKRQKALQSKKPKKRQSLSIK